MEDDEEKKYCDDEGATIGASSLVPLESESVETNNNSPARPRSSHRYLQRRLIKHGGNLKRRFSTSNLAEIEAKAEPEADASTMNEKNETTTTPVAMVPMIESEPETATGDKRWKTKTLRCRRENECKR